MIDSLDGILTRVLFHAPSKWNAAGVPFLIGKLTNGSIVKGELRKPMMGERYRFWGEWKAQKGRDEPAFEFTSHEVLVDQSVAGMVDYLMTYVDGLGIVKATALVETFGLDTLKTLRTQPEAALAVHGISETIAESIREHFQENAEFDPAAYAKLIDLFSNHRVPKKVVKALLKDFGSDAPNVVMESPYKLLAYPRMGWKTVDAFAMTTAGYDRAGIDRHKCAIVEALERLSNQGHTYGRRSDIDRITFELVDDRPRPDAWVAAEQEGLIVEVFGDSPGETSGTSGGASNTNGGASNTGELPGYALPKLAEAEAEIARRLAVLAATAEPLPFPLLDAVSEDDQQRDKHLNDDQIEAVRLVGENGVVILAGSPGTGKTLTITRVVSTLIGNGISSIRICTPTGKAAKRAAELLDQAGISTDVVPCTTIHRALGPRPSDAEEGASAAQAKVGRGREGFSFGRNEDNPLEVRFLVIDETSMVDVSLGASLLRAVAPGTRVVFVGDPNQLPSVGPGSVLRDMIAAGVPTAMLTQIQRSAGRIVRACHAIKDGVEPRPSGEADIEGGENWIHLESDEPKEIVETIVNLHATVKTMDPLWDMQVVTPQKTRLPFACDNLNRRLSALLNHLAAQEDAANGKTGEVPGEASRDVQAEGEEGYGPPFRIGDKVVRTKNGIADELVEPGPTNGFITDEEDFRVDWNWDGRPWRLTETDVVNGDMGTVLDIVPGDKDAFVVVRFRVPDRLCRLPYGDCHLIPAYAMTVHKCQGSGFPYVIVPVHHSFYWDQKTQTGLFNRELLYTAISRSEKLLVTVGQASAIRAAIGRKTLHQRNTRLRELLHHFHPIEVTSSEA